MDAPTPRAARAGAAAARILSAPAPRATHFIVTVYGDVVEPRGGALWMGALIALCAEAGLSETLVRTAVSRLVAAGRLEGERIGRRSYYRLTPAAQTEFAAASRVFFDPPGPARGFVARARTCAEEPEVAARGGWAEAGPGLMIGPARSDLPRPEGGAWFDVTPREPGPALRAFAAATWALDPVAEAYRALIADAAPLADAVAAGAAPKGIAALVLRLRLVHAYRRAALADPRLPLACLPADWPGRQARGLFLRLYLDLSPEADDAAAETLSNAEGPLPARPDAVTARLGRMTWELRDGPRF